MALEVLVVDDEADIRELVSGVLEDEGFARRAGRLLTQHRRKVIHHFNRGERQQGPAVGRFRHGSLFRRFAFERTARADEQADKQRRNHRNSQPQQADPGFPVIHTKTSG